MINLKAFLDLEDPFEILNISNNCSSSELKDRYYNLSKAFHPDKQPQEYRESAKAYFEKIENAYKAVSNPFSRIIYDNFGNKGIQVYTENLDFFIDLQKELIEISESEFQESKLQLSKVICKLKEGNPKENEYTCE